MTTIRKQQTPRSYNKIVYCVNQFAFIWYFFHGCSFYCFATIILSTNLEIHWFKRRRCKTANNMSFDRISKYTLKRASYATSPISRMELSTCSVTSTQQATKPLTCSTTILGTKGTETDTHFCAYNLRSKWNWFRCFIKCIIISGLVLVCSVWLWYFLIILICLFFLVFNMHSRKRKKMHFSRYRKCRRDDVFFYYYFFLIHACK